jgi:hypothetical protein
MAGFVWQARYCSGKRKKVGGNSAVLGAFFLVLFLSVAANEQPFSQRLFFNVRVVKL